MATLDAIGKELKGLTPLTTLNADGSAKPPYTEAIKELFA